MNVTKPKDSDTRLAPPYVIAYNKLKAFFEGDETYNLSELDDTTRSCTISTDNRLKYLVLKENLLTELPEGISTGLHIKVELIGKQKMTPKELAVIVEDNPHFQEFFETKEGPFPFSSVIFKNEVIQYYNDNLFDPYSHASTLCENLVGEIFKNKCYCTTAENK